MYLLVHFIIPYLFRAVLVLHIDTLSELLRHMIKALLFGVDNQYSELDSEDDAVDMEGTL